MERSYESVLTRFVGVPFTQGNRVDVLHNGEEIFPAMLDAVRGARRTIDFMTYVYWSGGIAEEFAEALAERARAGVRVRALLDGFGSLKMPGRLVDLLRESGVAVERFRPLTTWRLWTLNMRTHRRVLVCDEQVAFTGGVGIAEEWADGGPGESPRRETHFRIRGPAVWGLHAAFTADWLETGHPMVEDADTFPDQPHAGDCAVQVIRGGSQLGWNDMAVAMRALIAVAQHHIRITTAYFRAHTLFADLLCEAVDRGVHVDVLVPGPHADRPLVKLVGESNYERLLTRGLRIWRYQPAMLHAKIVTVDGAVAFVGTTNFDSRSIALNEQVGLVVLDERVAATLDAQFNEDLEVSEQIRLDQWRKRPRRQRLLEAAANAVTYGFRGAGAVQVSQRRRPRDSGT